MSTALTNTTPRFIYEFGNGTADGGDAGNDVLGGKGAGLGEMTQRRRAGAARLHHHDRGVPLVLRARRKRCPTASRTEQREALARLEQTLGKRLGDANDPLLVSVRSGAQVLDAGHDGHDPEPRAQRPLGRGAGRAHRQPALRVGLLPALPRRCSAPSCSGSRRTSSRTLLAALQAAKRRVKTDAELAAEDLAGAGRGVQGADPAPHRAATSRRIRTSSSRMARDAVFRSWNNDRAIYYRRQNGIPDDLGTAVNVQAMVFGNLGEHVRAPAWASRATRRPARTTSTAST